MSTYFRCEVVGSAAQRPCSRRTRFREAEICYFDVPVVIQQDVFGLEVTVNDVESVQMIQGQCYLSRVEFRDGIRESLYHTISTGRIM